MKQSSRNLSASSFFLSCIFFATSFFSITSAQNVYQGCYQLDDTLNLTDTSIYQSKGRCGGTICEAKKFAVFGMTSGSQCLCGNAVPAKQVTPDLCSIECPGYPNDTCGGTGYISVWLTGVGKLQGNAATTILSDSSTATTSNPSGAGSSNTVYVTAGQTTIIQVPTESASSSRGVSGGAAAGIAIGVLALVGIGAGAFFFVRRRQRRDAYQRQYEGSGFGSSPGSLNRPFGTDQRLEPSMVQKRESVGSLADEQDYSRKILRVTNPDGN